jgi:UDP-N-acetylmuramoylalanine--D-glutamate ligase
MNVQGKRVLVVGLARSGFAVACALARRGAVVTVIDRKPPAEFAELLPQLLKYKVGLELGSQRAESFLRHEVIVISPGVPWDLPQLQAARERGIPVYPEVEAATWFLEGTLVGVTGSNGKTTTTSLLGDMLKASGFPTFVGGNIGNALSSAVGHARPGTKFVTELSSFQLEGIHDFRPHVAVMLNLSPNHLDRHPSLEAYSQAKRRIFRNQGGKDFAVLNADDPWVAGLPPTLPSRPVFFSRRRELANGVFVSGGKIYYRTRHLERVLFETRDVTLRGDFNLEDVLAATTAACVLGADFTAIRKAVRAFPGVEHRLEFVREIQGVDFYNNSKATSVDATVKSLAAFERGVHLILGGKDKGAPYMPLLPLIRDRVREILLIGAAAPVIAQQLAGSTELVQAGDLDAAVYEAFARSRPGDTVLLAPACSSFDQFKDYEERGRVFKELVGRLAKDVAEGRVVRSPKSEVRSLGSGVTDLELGIRSVESGVSGAGSHNRRAIEEPEPSPGRITFADSPPVRTTAETGYGKRDTGYGKRERAHGTRKTGQGIRGTGYGPSPAEGFRPAGGTGDTDQGIGDTGHGIRDTAPAKPESDIHGTGLAQSPNPESQSPSSDSRVASPEPPVTSPEPQVSSPVSRTPYPVSRVPSPEPPVTSPAPEVLSPVSRIPSPVSRIELSYVYEVDAVELPAMESQVVPDDEPVISLAASTVETLGDEALPYEMREEESGVRSPVSEVQTVKSDDRGAASSAQPAREQSRLFDGTDN